MPVFNSLLSVTCSFHPVFVPLGVQVSEGGAEGRRVRVGGAALHTFPDSEGHTTDRTRKRQMKSSGVLHWKELVGFLSTLHHGAVRQFLTAARPSRRSPPLDACKPQPFSIKSFPVLRCDVTPQALHCSARVQAFGFCPQRVKYSVSR